MTLTKNTLNPRNRSATVWTLLFTHTLALTLATAPHARAESNNSFYASIYGGIGGLAETNTRFSTGSSGDVDFDPSFTGGGALGYAWNRWRFEGDLTYRTNEISGAANSLPTGSSNGDFSSLSLAANALYEFDLIPGGRARTYLGLGLVYVQEIDIDFELSPDEVSYSDSEFGVQLIGGAAYRLSDRWELLTDLRYLPLGSISLDGERSADGSVDADYDHWSLNVGLRYRFR
ncbi:MAG: porin family protein [Pseudomonadota bacterium]